MSNAQPKRYVHKSAVLSEAVLYRYRLSRWWGPGKRLVYLMMNPSTADASVDDATIRKCMGFAASWNYDGIEVVNLFALRSRDPAALVTAADPVGPDNLHAIYEVVKDIDTATGVVMCAWGCESTMNKMGASGFTLATTACGTIHAILRVLPDTKLMTFGLTKGGTPRHPLMLPYSTKAENYT